MVCTAVEQTLQNTQNDCNHGFLAAVECTKFVFDRGSAPDPTGELTALPRPSNWYKGVYFQGKGEGGERKEREGRKGREGRETGEGRIAPNHYNKLTPLDATAKQLRFPEEF